MSVGHGSETSAESVNGLVTELGPSPRWSDQLLRGARNVGDLVERRLITEAQVPRFIEIVEQYQMLVSEYYLSLIDPEDPHCPIRLQALPHPAELSNTAHDRSDPIGDQTHAVTPILVHRYPNRVLLMPTLRCPMFCRYCFRKVALNGEPLRVREHLDESMAYLAEHPEVEEVILTGGDPLMLSDARLQELFLRIREVPSIRRIRIHSRFPVTLPMRITDELVEIMADAGPMTIVAHFNHPREITPEADVALRRLRSGGIRVCNQAVLLAGVNDDLEIQIRLWSLLAERQVGAHYLHHLDLARGVGHFRVTLDRGLALSRDLTRRLGGLACPRYVIDIPGGGGKVMVDSGAVRPEAQAGIWSLESPLSGEITRWVDPAVHPDGVPLD
jgi:lysine 2,3-aminomutase